MRRFFGFVWPWLMAPLFWIVVVVLCVMCSCRSVEYVPVESSTDSIIVEKVVEVPLPPDSATVRALLECDEHGRIVLRWLDIANSKNAQAQLAIDSLGNLLAKMKTQPDTVYLPSKEVVVSKKEKVPYPIEKELSKWQQIRLEIGGFAIIILIIMAIALISYIIYKVINICK